MKMSGTTLKRKAAKRTCVTKSTAVNIKLSPDEDTPARKKPRLQASLPAIVADADTLNASPNASVAVPSPDAGTDPVAASSPTQLNVGATRAPLDRWTPEEDTKLTSAVKTTGKKKYGGDYRADWGAISKMVPGRTKHQCYNRWHNTLHCRSIGTTARVGKWTTEEDVKLKDAVEKHNGTYWAAISELVPGRTKQQCWNRWHDALHIRSHGTTTRADKWTAAEDRTLKDAVVKHHGNDWAAVSELVPGRTKEQCKSRWHDSLHSKGDATIKHTGKWTTLEDSTLKDAVEKHNGADWATISKMVPARTKKNSVGIDGTM
jgi:hypothetical protein